MQTKYLLFIALYLPTRVVTFLANYLSLGDLEITRL